MNLSYYRLENLYFNIIYFLYIFIDISIFYYKSTLLSPVPTLKQILNDNAGFQIPTKIID